MFQGKRKCTSSLAQRSSSSIEKTKCFPLLKCIDYRNLWSWKFHNSTPEYVLFPSLAPCCFYHRLERMVSQLWILGLAAREKRCGARASLTKGIALTLWLTHDRRKSSVLLRCFHSNYSLQTQCNCATKTLRWQTDHPSFCRSFCNEGPFMQTDYDCTQMSAGFVHAQFTCSLSLVWNKSITHNMLAIDRGHRSAIRLKAIVTRNKHAGNLWSTSLARWFAWFARQNMHNNPAWRSNSCFNGFRKNPNMSVSTIFKTFRTEGDWRFRRSPVAPPLHLDAPYWQNSASGGIESVRKENVLWQCFGVLDIQNKSCVFGFKKLDKWSRRCFD